MDYNFDRVDMIFCHRTCFDGAASAMILQKYVESKNYPKPNIYPYYHEKDPSNYKFPPVDGKHVAIVDISFTIDILLNFFSRCASLIVVDHHKSAQDELRHFNFCIFDMNRSACQIMYDLLYRSSNDRKVQNNNRVSDMKMTSETRSRPRWVDYIGQRDLFRFEKNDDTDYFSTMLYFETTKKNHFQIVDEIYHFSDEQIDEYIRAGRYHKETQICYEQKSFMCANKCVLVIPTDVLSSRNSQLQPVYTVYASDDYIHRSNVGSALSQRDDCDFAVLYKYNLLKHNWSISLRGQDNKTNCSEIAIQFGGGGHRNACAFTWNRDIREILVPFNLFNPHT